MAHLINVCWFYFYIKMGLFAFMGHHNVPLLAQTTVGDCCLLSPLSLSEVPLLYLKSLFSGWVQFSSMPLPPFFFFFALFQHSVHHVQNLRALPCWGPPVGKWLPLSSFFSWLQGEQACVYVVSWITDWIAASFYSSSAPHLWVDTQVFIFLLFPGNVSVG